MLTPQEVQNKKFVKAVFGGYDMMTVDEFLEQLTVDYTSLFKENAVLKNKLKVLVDSVEEYRSVDDSMRKALLSAQKMASQTVAEAEQQAQKIVADAEAAAAKRLSGINSEAAAEEKRLRAARTETAAFLAEMKRRLRQQLEFLEQLPNLEVSAEEPKPQKADNVVDAAEAIGNVVAQRILEEEQAVKPQAEPEAPLEDLEKTKKFPADSSVTEQTTTRINLNDLRFGKDYAVGQDEK